MKKCLFFLSCILLTLLLTSCDLFNGSLSEYIAEYTQNANLEMCVIPDCFPRDASENSCVLNTEGIQLILRNPLKFEINFEYTFNNQSIAEVYESDYKDSNPIQFTPVGEDKTIFNLIFPADFLEAIDTGTLGIEEKTKDISGTVHAYDKTTLRPFGSLELSLSANTPPAYSYAMLQLDQDPEGEKANQAHNVICFEMPHSARNNDFTEIKINNDVWKVEYDSYRDTIPNSVKLTPASGNKGTLIVNPRTVDDPEDPDYPIPVKPVTYPVEADLDLFVPKDPIEYDTFYYISTDIHTEDEKLYYITLTDEAEISTTGTISSKVEKLTPVILTLEPATGSLNTGIVAADDGFTTITVRHDGKTIKGDACLDKEHISLSWVLYDNDLVIVDQNTVFATSCTIKVPIGTGYTVEAIANCPNYVSSTMETTGSFTVRHSTNYFIAETGSNDSAGTSVSPYRSIQNAINDIKYEIDTYGPESGYTINVLSNLTPDEDFLNATTGSSLDNHLEARYLINMSHFDASGNPQASLTEATLTIRGSDANGNAANRTINAQGSAENSRMLVRWGGTNTLTLENLTLTGGYYKGDNQYCPGINLDASQGQTLTVTLNNVTITGNTRDTGTSETADMTSGLYFYGGYSFSPDSTLTLNNCTVSGNTSIGSGKGAAVTFKGETGAGKILIKGKNIIQNNVTNPDTDNLASNVYLTVSGGVNKVLTVESALSGGSRIGVTTATQPAVGEPVPFVDGWQASYGQPANFFTSDTGCGITTDDSDIPVFAVNSGSSDGYLINEDVTISVSSDYYIPGVEKKITVSATLNDTTPVDITDKVTSWHLELTENGEAIPTSWYTVSGNTITLKQALPGNTYTLYADIIYNGRHYSDSIAIAPQSPIASLTTAPTSGYVSASTASDFAQLATWVNGGSSLENVTILLDSDVTITGSYTAIGTNSTRFKGTFNGQGHTVNINSQTANALYYGLFGDVYGGTIKNVTVTGSITASGNKEYIGGIAGELTTGTIENCINNVTISGAKYAGGIVGFPVAGTIKNCLNNASVSGTQYAGGIGGSKNASAGDNTVIIINCVNNGNVTTSDTGEASGGITGHIGNYTQKLSLTNTANTGVITKNSSPSSEIYGGNTTAIKELKNVIYLQNSGSGTFSNDGTLYSASSYAAEIHAETSLSAIVNRLNSWINSQPAAERATYRKWKVSGTKIVFEEE